MRNKNISMSTFGTKIDKSLYKDIKTSVNNHKREYDFEVNLDSYNPVPTPTTAIFIKGDRNTSILKATVIKGEMPLNLSDFTITVNVKEGKKSTVTIPVVVVSESEGTIEINLPTNIVDEQGSNSFELSFQKGDEVIISQQYSYSVIGSLGEGDIGTPAQMTILQALITQVEESKNTVDTVITNGTADINVVITNGQNAIDSLVEELEVTQTDIDDIIGMVGGL